MATRLRIATFNLENLDDKPNTTPTLAERIALVRPQLVRLRADVLCLQEVNGQETPNQPRRLLALQQLVAGTEYAAFHVASTTVAGGGQVYDERNLVVLSRFAIAASRQLKHDLVPQPAWRMVTAVPPAPAPGDITWERPILHVTLTIPGQPALHIVNVHLKSRLPSDVPGQRRDQFSWKTASGWAEGSFISAVKRLGQALETRILVDQLFDADPQARIAICGDFNADHDDVTLEALCGEVENTDNGSLAGRVLLTCERTVPEPARFSLYHRGRGQMLDHVLVSRPLLAFYRSTEIHNEILHDESTAFATDVKYPESDHAPVVAELELP
jgi:endonuclease/exonuclease/phosphatase family metal-dependent hydrolase